MNVWIVGIDHELQLTADPTDSQKRRAQKDQLKDILTIGIPEHEVRFIAEESKLGKATIAMDMANSSIPTIPWINIVMTDAEREAAGVAEALKKQRPGYPLYVGTTEVRIECRIPEDEIREDFFINATLQEAQGTQSFLMLLGDLHLDATGEKLRRMGHKVTTNHELFPVKRWETCI
jgi:hypothetical protein